MLPIIGLVVGAVVTGGISLAAFGPGIGDLIQQELYGFFQSRWFSSTELLRLYYKQQITINELYSKMKYVGFSKENVDELLKQYPDQLNVTEALTLYFRYKDNPGNALSVNKEWLIKRLTQAGIDKAVHEETLEANRPVPSLQDIITFAVRDIFEPEQARQARLYEGVPDVYLKEAAKRGLSKEDAMYYWAAHWSLPGIHQVYEMFHRLYPGSGNAVTFTEKDMDVFFNLADIAHGYRDKLKAISYRPIGRVDIRRFWREGIYDKESNPKEALIRDYRQLGFNVQDSTRMAEWTIKYYGVGRRNLTRAQIESFYVNGLFGENGREQAIKELNGLGFDDNRAGLIIDNADLQTVTAEEQSRVDAIKADYLNGLIDSESELHTKLTNIPLPQKQVLTTIKSFQSEKAKRQTRLSRSEADKFYRLKIINPKEYKQILSGLGYSDVDIERILEAMGSSRSIQDKLPSKDDVLEWLTNGIIEQPEAIVILREIGYEDRFIKRYIENLGQPLMQESKNALEDKERKYIDEI